MKKHLLKSIIYVTFALCLLFGYTKQSFISAHMAYNAVPVPIVMYHSVLKDGARSNDFVITPEVFENDLKYLNENNYQTITAKDLVDYVYNFVDLPENPIIITLDDGYYNNYEYVFPLLKKYNMQAIISPIAKVSEDFTALGEENVTWGHISAKHILEMYSSGFIEFQNHSYDMHKQHPRKGVLKLSSESPETYQQILKKDIDLAQRFLIDIGLPKPIFYTYPFGSLNEHSEKVIKEMGFLGSFSAEAKVSCVSPGNPSSLYKLGRYNRPAGISTQSFFAGIEKNIT